MTGRLLWLIGWALLIIDLLFIASIVSAQIGVYPQ
jgi:hypothetical protein